MTDSSLLENRFYVYILRRPDREDPSEESRRKVSESLKKAWAKRKNGQ